MDNRKYPNINEKIIVGNTGRVTQLIPLAAELLDKFKAVTPTKAGL